MFHWNKNKVHAQKTMQETEAVEKAACAVIMRSSTRGGSLPAMSDELQ
jgi:hypothetical protein